VVARPTSMASISASKSSIDWSSILGGMTATMGSRVCSMIDESTVFVPQLSIASVLEEGRGELESQSASLEEDR